MSPYNPAWLLTALTLFFVSGAAAHEPGTAELRFDPATGDLRTELDLGDLDYLLRLDLNRDGTVSSDEIGLARSRIESFVTDSVTIDGCQADPTRSKTGLRRDSPPSVVVDLGFDCPDAPLRISSSLSNALPDYRVILRLDALSGTRAFLLAGAGINLDASASAGLGSFFAEGVHHILIGIDHLAFLLVLVLPLAVRGTWAERLRSTAVIVTAFTVAHSITLGLSALGHISLPAGPVEIVIATSVVIAALLNLHRQPLLPTWVWAYVFGLIHGFGFAGALGGLAISDGLHLTGLLAFNLGVEVGQLLVVAIALPVLGILEKLAPLRGRLAPAGSTLIALLGLFWILERL